MLYSIYLLLLVEIPLTISSYMTDYAFIHYRFQQVQIVLVIFAESSNSLFVLFSMIIATLGIDINTLQNRMCIYHTLLE